MWFQLQESLSKYRVCGLVLTSFSIRNQWDPASSTATSSKKCCRSFAVSPRLNRRKAISWCKYIQQLKLVNQRLDFGWYPVPTESWQPIILVKFREFLQSMSWAVDAGLIRTSLIRLFQTKVCESCMVGWNQCFLSNRTWFLLVFESGL